MPPQPRKLYWRAPSVKKLMQEKKIRDRAHLSRTIDEPYTTVQRAISVDWSGPVGSQAVLVAMAVTFNVRLSQLVHEPRDMAKGAAK